MSTANNLRRVSINLEALPRMDNYRNSPFHQLDRENSSAGSRPTLEQLHESSLSSGTADSTHQVQFFSSLGRYNDDLMKLF